MSKPLERTWILRESPFDAQHYTRNESLFAIGNGYVGVRGTFEEGYPGELATTYVHGIFDHAEGEQVPELVNAPNWLNLTIAANGAPFGIDTAFLLGYERTLDMYRGVLTRRALWQSGPGGPVLRFAFERFASRARQHVMALRARVTALDQDVALTVEARLDGNVSNEGVRHWGPWQQGGDPTGPAWLLGETMQSGYALGMAAAFENDAGVAPEYVDAAGSPTVRLAFDLKKGATVTLTRLVALHTSRDVAKAQVLPATLATLRAAADAGYDALCAEHEAGWAADWARSDVVIEGDERAQRALRFALYHLLIAAPWNDDAVSIGAKTLSGPGYKGHVFWDTELFMLSPLTYTQPEVARNLLTYRYNKLQGARNKAREEGYRGAMFPWESTDTGEETTPKWTPPHPETGERIRIWTGDREQHINADIAYAICQYWHWSGDDAFMRDHGAEVVLDTARFWASRAEHDAAADRYELHNQIGPDEYHENVSNSVFVNRMVVWHLETALGVFDWLHTRYPDKAADLEARLALTPAERALWRDIAAKMVIPFDAEQGIHVQFDGFFDLEYVDVPAYTPRVTSLQSIYGVERTNQTQVIKQADVVMLMALLGDALAPHDVRLRNWAAYAPRCDHGSSLSAATHAWVAARLGLLDAAYAYFEKAAGTDLEDNKGNTAHGIHGAACGGLWQAVALGFVGLHLDADGNPAADPALPAQWSSVRFRFFHRGQQYELIARQGEAAQICAV